MENEFFLNAGLHPRSVSSTMEIDQSQDWGAEQSMYFESALIMNSLISSSPAQASNSNIPGDGFMIRDIIGRLGNITNNANNPGEILPSSVSSCFSTPSNSPPRIKLPGVSCSPATAVPDLSADPAFAERAARFSCFGSRSFNGRTTPFGGNNNAQDFAVNRSVAANGKLPRVSSVPSLKAVVSQDDCVLSQKIPSTGVKFPGDFSRKRKSVPKGKVIENSAGASPSNNSTKVDESMGGDSDSKRVKLNEKNPGENNPAVKSEKAEEKQSKKDDNTKPAEPIKDYIHVRARRGQATDSHSLAERVRREKIGERMKLLQDIVPGCNKVTGKALMLDEIINYVQSLQRQVEFLSMKLASVNTSLDFNMDSLMSKNAQMIQTNNSIQSPMFPYDSSAAQLFGQQNPTAHRNLSSNGTPSQNSMDSLSTIHPFTDTHTLPEYSFCEDDLQTIVQMGFGQNLPQEMQQFLQGTSQMQYIKRSP